MMVYWCPYFVVVWQDWNLLPFIFKAILYEQKTSVFPTFRETLQEVNCLENWLLSLAIILALNQSLVGNTVWCESFFYAVRNIFALGLLFIFQDELFGWDGKSKYHTIQIYLGFRMHKLLRRKGCWLLCLVCKMLQYFKSRQYLSKTKYEQFEFFSCQNCNFGPLI